MEEKTKSKEQPEIPEIYDYEKCKPPVRPKTVVESFKYAVDGILDVFRTQKHMRFHFVAVVIVLLAGVMFDMDKSDMLVLLFTVSLVLIAEMFNTAIEAVVDLVTQEYHPLAKFAKDAAAGAVLIATMTAVLIAFVLSFSQINPGRFGGEIRPEESGVILRVIIAGVIILVLTIAIKALRPRGKLLKGGFVSGHTALGFFLASTILFYSKNALLAVLAVLIALLVAQSRVEAKIHSIQEVVTGALLAMLVTAVVYYLMTP